MDTLLDNAGFAIIILLVYAPLLYIGGCIISASLRPDDG